jgi:hypothetical protein
MNEKKTAPQSRHPLKILLLAGLFLLGIPACKDSAELPEPGDGTCLLLTQKKGDGTLEAAYTWDAERRLIRADYGEQADSFYTVDYSGDVVTITHQGGAGTFSTICTLNAEGFVEESRHSNGFKSYYTYSGEGHLLRAETRNAEDSLLTATDFSVLEGNLMEKKVTTYGAEPDVLTITYTYYADRTDRNGIFHFMQEGETPFSSPPVYGKPSVNLPKTKTVLSQTQAALNQQKEYTYELCRIGNMLGREILVEGAPSAVDRYQYDCE